MKYLFYILILLAILEFIAQVNLVNKRVMSQAVEYVASDYSESFK